MPRTPQEILIEALLEPARYPHPVERVERIETHGSTILLAGEFAYKIKKPVDLGFLDFSSLERRAHFCAEEVRLNRRLAADLYLASVPITGSPGDPVVGGEGTPIEYAVLMRRFPQQGLLSARLARRELPPELMDRLGRDLADFHAAAATAPADSDFGRPAQVALPVRDSLRALRRLVPEAELDRVAALDGWLDDALARLQPRFCERREGGRVRECHGDLHLGNIALWGERLLMFDGIEFDPQLRWIDVMSDLAFALMDLDYRSAAAHADRLKSAYLEASGDYQGLAVLRFYQLYRALVRAKIAGVRLQQLGVESPERPAQEAELAGYLRLATDYGNPRQPRLAITFGLSGSGKSTLAQALVESRGYLRIRSDIERKRLFGLASAARSGSALDSGLYDAQASARTYDRLLGLARCALEAGERVVVDAAFLRQDQRRPFHALVESLSLPLDLLWADAPPETLRSRVTARLGAGLDASEADLAVLARQQETVEWPEEAEGRVVRIATGRAGWRERLRRAFR